MLQGILLHVSHVISVLYFHIKDFCRSTKRTLADTASAPTPTPNMLQEDLMAAASRSEYPIRVVDVAATLKNGKGVIFRVPKAWSEFCVISHTWSQEVRDMSVEMAHHMEANAKKGYEEAFGDADLSGNGCYKKLERLLGWLEGYDRVEGVWMDALCINQCDEREKEAEIGRMGEYYSKSHGCYVLPHGVGRYAPQYEQPSLQSDGRPYFGTDMGPRWFHRVWTLQEWLLPLRPLVFLLGDLPSHAILTINDFILRRPHVTNPVGFCKCCTVRDVIDVTNTSYDQRLLADDDIIVAPHRVCNVCGSGPLILKVDSTTKNMYFACEEAYLSVISFLGMLDSANTNDRLGKLLKLRESRAFEAWDVLYHSCGGRDCSPQHQEDRILSILGLLGVSGSLQVRTQLSLEEQVLRTASHDHELAFALCVVTKNTFFQKPGLSWAADLTKMADPQAFGWLNAPKLSKQDLSPHRHFQIKSVTLEGLSISARLYRAHISLHKSLDTFTLHISDDMPYKLTVKQACSPPHSFEDSYVRFQSSHLSCSHALQISVLEFVVWLIPLTSYTYSGALIAMLCVGQSPSYLHNLGNIYLYDQYFDMAAKGYTDCLIGGYGVDVPEECLVAAHKLYLDE